MTTRAAPGTQLSAGRLRVDAAKAIAKLREYQLADRTAWILEAIRAAVAGGAKRIVLRGDANDVWLAWEGPAWPADDLPRLFDELVSPEPASERHHVRLLAAAVNSALGLEPAYVDVWSLPEDGAAAARRARFTPDVLDEGSASLDDSPLRRIAAEPATPPAGIAPGTGMLVHLRRRAALGMITYLFWERESPELALARAACGDIAVPLDIQRDRYHRDQHRRDVLRVPLGDGLDGFVGLLDPATWRGGGPTTDMPGTCEVAERGVALAVHDIGLGLPGPHTACPVRVFVDAPRMPTNASRSQVRREHHPIAAAEKRAPEAMRALIDELVAILKADPETQRPREAALALIGSALPREDDWTTDLYLLRGPLAKLAALPLVRDATGKPRPVASDWGRAVYTGRQPLAPSLERWLSTMLWVPPGSPTARLVEHVAIDARATRRYIKWARRQARAHARFYQHAPRVDRLTTKEPWRLRMPFGGTLDPTCVPQHVFAPYAGELCLQPGQFVGELIVLLEGRELDRVRVPSPIGFTATVNTLAITPAEGYRGVERNSRLEALQRASQFAVVRACEALAILVSGGALPDHVELADREPTRLDADIARRGLQLAVELGLPIHAPLTTTKIFEAVDGSRASVVLLRTRGTVGVALGSSATQIANRIVLVGGTSVVELLRRVAPELRVIAYDGYKTGRAEPHLVATRLATTHQLALAMRDGDGVVGAIAPAATSVLRIQHATVPLDERRYDRRVLDCTIVADSDAVIPGDKWRGFVDHGGLLERDFTAWETALVRALAASIVGERPVDLVGSALVQLDEQLAAPLCQALAASPDVDALLGRELAAKLRAFPQLRVLGSYERISVDELVKRSPRQIQYVAPDASPTPDFTPLAAPPHVAKAVARLAGLEAFDATHDLRLRQVAAARKARLADHRARPVRSIELPGGGAHVALDDDHNPVIAKGVVGVGHDGLEIDVLIEQRPFARIHRPDDLPLRAIVDIPLLAANASFDGLPELTERQLAETVGRRAPALLRTIAGTQAHLLAEVGAERTLLVQFLAHTTAISAKTRKALCKAPAFRTVQGERVSIDFAAARPALDGLAITSWQGAWLERAADEEASALDGPVLQVPAFDGELHAILKALHDGAIVDVTEDCAKLQKHRQMARGLVPVPTLPDVPGELRRKLAELGAAGKQLGHGEIGLVEHRESYAVLHEHGLPRERRALDVMPAIALAIEAPDLGETLPPKTALAAWIDDSLDAQLRALRLREGLPTLAPTSPLDERVQTLAVHLVRDVLTRLRHAALPVAVRRNIRRAVLARRVDPDVVGKAPLFETVDGSWVAWSTLQEQMRTFGDVWAVTEPVADRPIDERRLVLALDRDELALATLHQVPIVEAREQLALDALTRRNRARAPASSLALPARAQVLAEITLDGDGDTAARGTVAVLAPSGSAARGVHPHRDLHPFDRVDDPCPWPTLAVVDDARYTPDRTWSRPVDDVVWRETVIAIHKASERALATIGEPPEEALAVQRIGPTATDSLPSGRGSKVAIRGALWLSGAPRVTHQRSITAFDDRGRFQFLPKHNVGMGGYLVASAPDGWIREVVLEELCVQVHGALLRKLAGSPERETDVGAAHLAHGLALRRITVAELGATKFPCHRPDALSVYGLQKVLLGSEPVRVLEIDQDGAGIVEDGSELARVVIAWLGARGLRGELPSAPIATGPARPPVVDLERPAPLAPRAEPAPPAPSQPHPVRIVVEAVTARLADLGMAREQARIEDRSEPIVRFTDRLRFAGDNPRLIALANALRARSPWAELAIDALAAHVMTVLNVALTPITDAAEIGVLQALLARRAASA